MAAVSLQGLEVVFRTAESSWAVLGNYLPYPRALASSKLQEIAAFAGGSLVASSWFSYPQFRFQS